MYIYIYTSIYIYIHLYVYFHLKHSSKGLFSMLIGPTALIQHPNAIPN